MRRKFVKFFLTRCYSSEKGKGSSEQRIVTDKYLYPHLRYTHPSSIHPSKLVTLIYQLNLSSQIPCVVSNVRGLGMDRTHVVANLYVPAVAFQTMIMRHITKKTYLCQLQGKTQCILVRVSTVEMWKKRFSRLGYTTGSHFHKPESY